MVSSQSRKYIYDASALFCISLDAQVYTRSKHMQEPEPTFATWMHCQVASPVSLLHNLFDWQGAPCFAMTFANSGAAACCYACQFLRQLLIIMLCFILKQVCFSCGNKFWCLPVE